MLPRKAVEFFHESLVIVRCPESNSVSVKCIIRPWNDKDDSHRLESPALERSFVYEWYASPIVWEKYIQQQHYIIDGVDYRSLFLIHVNQKLIGNDLYRFFQDLSVINLFNYLNAYGKPVIYDITGVIRTGMSYNDFIKHYDMTAVENVMIEMQRVIDEYLK
jgi:hypothetical protein